MKTAWIVTLNLLLLGGGAVALAHHSYAMFDRDKKLALTGTRGWRSTCRTTRVAPTCGAWR